MIGPKEISDTTALLYGGNSLTDRVMRAEAHRSTTDSTKWNPALYETLYKRKGGKLTALPIISDELHHFSKRHVADQAS